MLGIVARTFTNVNVTFSPSLVILSLLYVKCGVFAREFVYIDKTGCT